MPGRHDSLIAVLVLAAQAYAPAASAAGSRRDAERSFRHGRELLKAGHLDAACSAFERSLAADPALGTLLNLAYCHELAGRTASAHDEYKRAAKQARAQDERRRVRFAEQHLGKLEAKLSFIVVSRTALPSRARVAIDGRAVTDRVALDPGPHRIDVSLTGHRSWRQRVTLAKGPTTLTVFVPADALPPVAAPHRRARQQPRPDAGRRWVLYGGGALALVGVGAGSYFGLTAIARKRSAGAHCRDAYCDDTGLALHDEAKQAATWSTVGFVAGAVGASAVAVTLLAWPRSGGADVRLATDGQRVLVDGRF